MRVIATLARPLLASVFITGGLDAARAPGGRTQAAEKLGLPQPELMVRLNGAAMVAGGTALALGYRPRRAALLLAGTLLPTTYTGHAFWEHEGEAKQMQQIHFLKNLSMLGGLLLAASEPRPVKQPRAARQAAKHVAAAAAAAATEQRKAEVGGVQAAEKQAAKVQGRAEKRAAKVEAQAAKAAQVQAKDRKRAEKTAKRAQRAAGAVAKAETKAEKRAASLAQQARKEANAVLRNVDDRERVAA